MDDEHSHFPSYQQYLQQNHMDEDGNYNPKTLKDCIYDKLPENLYQLIDDLDPNTKLIPSNINDDETNRRYYSTVYGKADLYDDDVANKEEEENESADEIETHEVWSGGGINTKDKEEVVEKNTNTTIAHTTSKKTREDDISTITDEISKLTFTTSNDEEDEETCPICTVYLSTGGISPPSKVTKTNATHKTEQKEEQDETQITPYKMPCCNAKACTKCTSMIHTKLQQQRDGYKKAEFGTTWCLHCCIPTDLKDSNSISEYTTAADSGSSKGEGDGDNKGEDDDSEDDILDIDPITLKKRKGKKKKKKRTLTNEEARNKEDNAWIFPRDERYEDYRIPGTPFKVGNYEDLIKGIVKESSVKKKEEEGDMEEEVSSIGGMA